MPATVNIIYLLRTPLPDTAAGDLLVGFIALVLYIITGAPLAPLNVTAVSPAADANTALPMPFWWDLRCPFYN